MYSSRKYLSIQVECVAYYKVTTYFTTRNNHHMCLDTFYHYILIAPRTLGAPNPVESKYSLVWTQTQWPTPEPNWSNLM